MLDQNTDRMWYVIGAVIVGAVLIFLMNGTFPTLFANVGTTFEEKVGQTTEMTDGIRPIAQNLIDVDAMTVKKYVNHQTGGYATAGGGEYYAVTDYIRVTPGTTLELTVPSGKVLRGGPRFVFYGADRQYVSGEMVENGARYEIVVPQGAQFIRIAALDADSGIKQTSMNADGQYDKAAGRSEWVLRRLRK